MNEDRIYTYAPTMFNKSNVEEAKKVILSSKYGRDSTPITTEMRWKNETKYFMDIIDHYCQLNEDSYVLDYGCGIGRMAKPIIEKYGCRVVGIDISPDMRRMAVDYVNSDLFMVCSPTMYHVLAPNFDFAMAFWVFLHCLKPEHDITMIRNIMKPGGKMFVANDVYRVIPTVENIWVDDHVDVKQILNEIFPDHIDGKINIEHPTLHREDFLKNTYWGIYTK